MLKVKLSIDSGYSSFPVGEVRIERIRENEDGTCNYTVQLGVDKNGALGIHSKLVYKFPRNTSNALALLLAALTTLTEEDFQLDQPLTKRSRPPNYKRMEIS